MYIWARLVRIQWSRRSVNSLSSSSPRVVQAGISGEMMKSVRCRCILSVWVTCTACSICWCCRGVSPCVVSCLVGTSRCRPDHRNGAVTWVGRNQTPRETGSDIVYRSCSRLDRNIRNVLLSRFPPKCIICKSVTPWVCLLLYESQSVTGGRKLAFVRWQSQSMWNPLILEIVVDH